MIKKVIIFIVVGCMIILPTSSVHAASGATNFVYKVTESASQPQIAVISNIDSSTEKQLFSGKDIPQTGLGNFQDINSGFLISLVTLLILLLLFRKQRKESYYD